MKQLNLLQLWRERTTLIGWTYNNYQITTVQVATWTTFSVTYGNNGEFSEELSIDTIVVYNPEVFEQTVNAYYRSNEHES